MAGETCYMQAEKQVIKICQTWMKPSKPLRSFYRIREKACGHQLKSERFIKSMEAFNYQSNL